MYPFRNGNISAVCGSRLPLSYLFNVLKNLVKWVLIVRVVFPHRTFELDDGNRLERPVGGAYKGARLIKHDDIEFFLRLVAEGRCHSQLLVRGKEPMIGEPFVD